MFDKQWYQTLSCDPDSVHEVPVKCPAWILAPASANYIKKILVQIQIVYFISVVLVYGRIT